MQSKYSETLSVGTSQSSITGLPGKTRKMFEYLRQDTKFPEIYCYFRIMNEIFQLFSEISL